LGWSVNATLASQASLAAIQGLGNVISSFEKRLHEEVKLLQE